MFIERNICNPEAKSGWIEVIAGCMFSGKTEELIRRLKRSQIAGQKIAVFKPKTDNRYSATDVVTHDKSSMRANAVAKPADIIKLAAAFDVVGIDEANFFDNSIIDVATDLANSGKRVIIAGLDMDFSGRPFGPMPYLMAIAEFVTKVNAICMQTGEIATHSYRDGSKGEGQIVVGAQDAYQALTRRAYFEKMKGRETYRAITKPAKKPAVKKPTKKRATKTAK